MKYALAVEVKLVEIPDDDHPEIRPGSDPLQGAVSLMRGRIAQPPQGAVSLMTGRIARPFHQPAGFDFRKQITIGVHGFSGLAAIIGRFDELVTDIEHEKLRV